MNWKPGSIPHDRDEAIEAARWLRDMTDLARQPNQEQLEKVLRSWCITVDELMADQPPEAEGVWVCALMQLTDTEDEGALKLHLRVEFRWRHNQAADESTLGGPAQDYPLKRFALSTAQDVADGFIETLWIMQYITQCCADIANDTKVTFKALWDAHPHQGTVQHALNRDPLGVPVDYLILSDGVVSRPWIIDAENILEAL